ncbi:hypothetical protein VMCG_09880 [Cytospora schulzeri]|uniref:Uncharacterized protein n=1 Tax=Cytospora schulzeri TaxID=448051 RepID=A0A423VDS5_9PEZI|nr:hypothetical protein VMCG_09880 [Valsa malicola]
MWDMMLYGGAPYSRRYRRSRRSSKKGRKCRACKEHIGKVTVGGKKVDMVYCEKHHCQKILANGSVCQEQRNGRNPLWKYCDLRSDDMPCMKYVKDADPEKFRYCSDRSKGYCPQHSCLAKPHKNTCDQPRLVQDGSPFCEKHTCESPTCTAEVDGSGNPGDAGRSCDQHRRCAAEGCAGPCFRRDTGAGLRWCGLHYCHRDPCAERRAAGSEGYCEGHVCVEVMCGAGRKEMGGGGGGGRFCADHQCRAEGCLERRDLRVRGDHKPKCPASTLGGTQCDKRLDNGQRYCKDHSCELASCNDQRRPDSLQYCPGHKCSVSACQQLRKNTIAGLDLLMLAANPLRAGLMFGAGADAGGGLMAAAAAAAASSCYCSAHACQGDGGRCGERVAEQ